MAYYKALELSFVGTALVQEGTVVDINDDPSNGGMTPGANLAACDAEGNLTAAKPAAKSKPAKAAKPAAGDDEQSGKGDESLA
jgi:hypothetical protein